MIKKAFYILALTTLTSCDLVPSGLDPNGGGSSEFWGVKKDKLEGWGLAGSWILDFELYSENSKLMVYACDDINDYTFDFNSTKEEDTFDHGFETSNSTGGQENWIGGISNNGKIEAISTNYKSWYYEENREGQDYSTIRIYGEDKELKLSEASISEIGDIDLNPNGSSVVIAEGYHIEAGDAVHYILIWDYQSDKLSYGKTGSGFENDITQLEWTPNGINCGYATQGGFIQVFDSLSFDIVNSFDGNSFAFSSDSKKIAIRRDNDIQVIELGTGNNILSINTGLDGGDNIDGGSHIAWSPDGKLIATTIDQAGKKRLVTYNMNGEEKTNTFISLGSDFLGKMQFTPDSRNLLGIVGRSIWVWE